MPDAVDQPARNQIERVGAQVENLSADHTRLAGVVERLVDRIDRDGKVHEAAMGRQTQALEEVFQRLREDERATAVVQAGLDLGNAKIKWLVGGLILAIGAVQGLVVAVVGAWLA